MTAVRTLNVETQCSWQQNKWLWSCLEMVKIRFLGIPITSDRFLTISEYKKNKTKNMIFGDVLSGIVDNCSMSVLQSRLKYSNNIQKTISLPKKKTRRKNIVWAWRTPHIKSLRKIPHNRSLEFQIVYPTLAGRPTYTAWFCFRLYRMFENCRYNDKMDHS